MKEDDAQAYKEGREAGSREAARRRTVVQNPYTDEALSYAWHEGFIEGFQVDGLDDSEMRFLATQRQVPLSVIRTIALPLK